MRGQSEDVGASEQEAPIAAKDPRRINNTPSVVQGVCMRAVGDEEAGEKPRMRCVGKEAYIGPSGVDRLENFVGRGLPNSCCSPTLRARCSVFTGIASQRIRCSLIASHFTLQRAGTLNGSFSHLWTCRPWTTDHHDYQVDLKQGKCLMVGTHG